MITYRPTDEMLADYAAGSTLPGMSLLVAAHLTYDPESRAKVAAFERLGGALLRTEEAVPMAPDALDAIFAQIDGGAAEPVRLPEAGPLTRPVADAIGIDFGEIPWKLRLPGVAEYELDGYGDEKVSLLRARPGARVPQHTHEVSEATLILHGALSDAGIVYRKGDVALNDHEDDHRPQAVGEETCYCLIVQQGSLRFTGRFSRILNYLGE